MHPLPRDRHSLPSRLSDQHSRPLLFLSNHLPCISWFIIGENIWTDTHDSVEVARLALRLYGVDHKLKEWSVFEEMLEQLYRTAKQHVRKRNVVRPRQFVLIDALTELETTANELTSPRHGSLAWPGPNLIFVGVRLPRRCERDAVPIGQNHALTRKCHGSERFGIRCRLRCGPWSRFRRWIIERAMRPTINGLDVDDSRCVKERLEETMSTGPGPKALMTFPICYGAAIYTWTTWKRG